MQLAALASDNRSAAEKAAGYFAELPFEAERQQQVSIALNGLDRPGIRKSADRALLVWGTEENISLISNMLLQERFDKKTTLEVVAKLKEPRLIEPLIGVLADPFDDGRAAEALLIAWESSADEQIARHANHPDDETHNRIIRIIEARDIPLEAIVRQSVTDLHSSEPQQRKYAAERLAEAEEIPAELHAEACSAAIELLEQPGRFEKLTKIHASKIIGKSAHSGADDKFLQLLEHDDIHVWQGGLVGAIKTGNAEAANLLAERMQRIAFAGPASRIMIEAGTESETLALATLRQPIADDGTAHVSLAHVLGEIGGRKSLRPLTALAKRRGVPDSVTAAARVAALKVDRRLKSGD
jgi:hypothetical protein